MIIPFDIEQDICGYGDLLRNMRIVKRELWRISIVPLREGFSCQPILALSLRVSEVRIGTYVLLTIPRLAFAVALVVASSGACCRVGWA